MYKEVRSPLTNEITGTCRTEDGAHIPFDLSNRDYIEYLAWVAEGNTPDTDTPTLDDLKATVLAQIDAKVDATFAAGFTVTSGAMVGEVLQIRNTLDRTNWLTSQAAYSAAMAAGAGSVQGAVFRTTANNTFTLSYADGFAIIMSMAAWGQSVYTHSWALKDAVNAADDQAELDAIDLNADWPG